MPANKGSVDPGILENIKKQLEGLRRTPDGHALYSLIERGLARYGRPSGGIEQAFINFIYVLLGNYINKDNSDPATRLKARLVQQRLATYLPDEQSGKKGKLQPLPTDRSQTQRQAPAPAGRQSRLDMVDALTRRSRHPRAGAGQQRGTMTGTKHARRKHQPITTRASKIDAQQPPVADDEKRHKIEQLHDLFSQRLTDSLLKSQEIDDLLRANMKALQLADDPADIRDIKRLLVRGLEELMDGYQDIAGDLQATQQYLKVAQQDRALLHDEARMAKRYSRADAITGLPKRAYLESQLEAEIGRSKRFGFSIAVALLDLDNFTAINRRYGRDAGDEVLRFYASEVLVFRKYDIVTRFGNDEFAVMFPNTQKEGALNALEQAQKRAAGLAINFKGASIVLPTFTSVLTLYAPGEQPRKLLQRTVDTLSRVKERGANQLVVSLPTS